MTDRDTVRRALYDAIDWQESLADAWQPGSPERAEAKAQAKAYRAVLKRRYAERETPAERAFDGCELVTLDELRRRAQAK